MMQRVDWARPERASGSGTEARTGPQFELFPCRFGRGANAKRFVGIGGEKRNHVGARVATSLRNPCAKLWLIRLRLYESPEFFTAAGNSKRKMPY